MSIYEPCAISSPSHLQKFRTYLLEQDKSMDILAYFLCYFLEIKDKPGNERALITTPVSVRIQSDRTTRTLSNAVLHHSDALPNIPLAYGSHSRSSLHTYLQNGMSAALRQILLSMCVFLFTLYGSKPYNVNRNTRRS